MPPFPLLEGGLKQVCYPGRRSDREGRKTMGRSIFVILGLLPVALSLSGEEGEAIPSLLDEMDWSSVYGRWSRGRGADNCPPDWSHFNQSCYRFFNQSKTWDEAELTCRQEGGHLASIKTQEDMTALSSMYSYRLFLNVWSGLRDPRKERRWEWSDGSKFSNNLWMQKQLDKLGKCNGCVELRISLLGPLQWKDEDCETKRSFICQLQPGLSKPSP